MNEDALRRVEATLGDDVVERLCALPGADLTTILLEVARRRAEAIDPAGVLRRYRSDRFVRPGTVPAEALRVAEGSVAASLPDGTATLVPAPLVPLGTHVIAGVAPTRVVATVRGTEVAADPTNALALEAAARRRSAMETDPRSNEVVRLAACQRVTRAQTFAGPLSFSHFTLFGFVTAGRDTGNLGFERAAAPEHAAFVTKAIRAATGYPAVVGITDLSDGTMAPVVEAMTAAVEAVAGASVRREPDRTAGRGYYGAICFKGYVDRPDGPLEVADGGFVDWTRRLVASRKERLMISGIGVDRLADAAASA